MFNQLTLTNFAAFTNLEWPQHAAINVIIGENDTGKTHLLKVLYAIGRSINEFQTSQNGPMPRPWSDILVNKLLWTFQPQGFELGKLASKGKRGTSVDILLNNEIFFLSLNSISASKITRIS